MELWGFFTVDFFLFLILSSAAITVFSCPGSVTMLCHCLGDGGGKGRGVSLQGTNVGITHPCSAGSIFSVPNTLESWKQSLATPQPCKEGRGTRGLEKILWQYLMDFPFKKKKKKKSRSGFWLLDGVSLKQSVLGAESFGSQAR